MNDPEEATSPRTRRWWIAGATAAFFVAAAAGSWFAFGRDDHHTANTTADAAMSARAQQVMPFDLNRTTHTFTQTAQGGVEKVVVNEPSDTRDRDRIRAHLRTEAENFRQGNYSDPAKIHGMDMPGVNALEEGAARVKVVYAPTSGGAQITYTSTEAALISALHAWFDRQAADHSAPGMGG
ncbi:MAG TPA: aspartate carbamoyltransferase [Acidimicrobiia bacterium]|nr:aspartate carbamoyltransferase [Acidimicrobiia bacterium]